MADNPINISMDYPDAADCDSFYSDRNPVKSVSIRSTIYTIYTVIFLVSIVGNGFVCYIVLASNRMRTVTNYFILNLALGELLITLLCIPFTAVAVLEQYWPFGDVFCIITSYSQGLSVFVSAYTLVAISIDKYMIIMWPLKPRISKRFATSVIAVVWFVAALTVLPIALTSKLFKVDNSTCERYICREDYSDVGEEYGIMYSHVLMLLQYIVPTAVLLFTYTKIGIVIWCHRIPGEAENSRDQRIAKSKKKMIKMMVTVVFVYSLCWLPYNLHMVFQLETSPPTSAYIFFTLHTLAMSHACYNPIIYCYMNARFRTGFLSILGSVPCLRKCIQARIKRATYSNHCPQAGIEGTENTFLHRTNTSTSHVSILRKNYIPMSHCNHQASLRPSSLMRHQSNNQAGGPKRIIYSNQSALDEQQI